ncbi:response regulator [Micromonospora sp. CPCC 205371]|nr:response regulator [Micromonospora sp. CPCC 205371]
MLRCLLVDDSTHFLAAASVLLERDGVAVVGVASTGAQALAAAAQLRPDVTLVDIDLGGESGFEVSWRLAQQAGTAVPIILTSAHDEEDYAELIAESPAIGFLSKTALSGRAIRDVLDRVGGPREQ